MKKNESHIPEKGNYDRSYIFNLVQTSYLEAISLLKNSYDFIAFYDGNDNKINNTLGITTVYCGNNYPSSDFISDKLISFAASYLYDTNEITNDIIEAYEILACHVK